MLTHAKIPHKLELSLQRYKKLRFVARGLVDMEYWQTKEHFRSEPGKAQGATYKPAKPGLKWGGSWITAWFCGDLKVPQELDGKALSLRFVSGKESLLFVDGKALGTFNEQHPVVQITTKATAGAKHRIAIEAYSGHNFPSTMPYDEPIVIQKNAHQFDGCFLVEERSDVTAYVIDLEILLKLAKALDANSLRRGKILAALQQVWATVAGLPEEVPEEEWRPALAKARRIMAPLLAAKNGDTAPAIEIVAHSHMDTAWLWPIAETRRKCGRTYSSMANLMARYPEVIFLQSSPVHADFIRQDYPELFEEMKRLVKKGRWEPNGGCWVEPDCNLTSGEALVRQFLHGILWTREHYGYSSDTLWQPDVFGYSAALPQILQQCGIRYFCTTKMAWNDTTRFPYDTFEWQGIDGTRVLTHLNSLPQFIDSDEIINLWNFAQHKDSEEKRLASYGWGDGGGGPTAEDMEKVRRLEDLEGVPKVRYTTVSDFMKSIEEQKTTWPRWVGELYLELHRGTLTAIAAIKRGNRKSELALRDAEILWNTSEFAKGAFPRERFHTLWRELLINQFHDILPGTSINEAMDEAVEAFGKIIEGANQLCDEAIVPAKFRATKDSEVSFAYVANTLSATRYDYLVIPNVPKGLVPIHQATHSYQRVVDLDGNEVLLVDIGHIDGLETDLIPLGPAARGLNPAASAFRYTGDRIVAPYGTIRFDKLGRIRSYVVNGYGFVGFVPNEETVLLQTQEIVGDGGTLNSFLVGEDIPQLWDQWDIDSDIDLKLAEDIRLQSRDVIADGPLQFRLRSVYRIGRASVMTQDMVLHANTPQISFETKVDWRDTHKLLKVAFDTRILSENARYEVQFGHVERPTHRNYLQDRARFEVCCHKWMDLSDNGSGVALLNDCKYGASTFGSRMTLSLIKSGTHPDTRADHGIHRFNYALLPHIDQAFSVRAVIQPAYEFNVPHRTALLKADPWSGKHSVENHQAREGALCLYGDDSVIIEAIKRAETSDDIIVRLYESGRRRAKVTLRVNIPVREVHTANMLEEPQTLLKPTTKKEGVVEIPLEFRAFEVKTLLLKKK